MVSLQSYTAETEYFRWKGVFKFMSLNCGFVSVVTVSFIGSCNGCTSYGLTIMDVFLVSVCWMSPGSSLAFRWGLTTYSMCPCSCHCVCMWSSLQTLSHTIRLIGLLIFCICLWLYVQWPPMIAMIHNFWKIHFVICSLLQYICCTVHLKEILLNKKKRKIVLTQNGHRYIFR